MIHYSTISNNLLKIILLFKASTISSEFLILLPKRVENFYDVNIGSDLNRISNSSTALPSDFLRDFNTLSFKLDLVMISFLHRKQPKARTTTVKSLGSSGN